MEHCDRWTAVHQQSISHNAPQQHQTGQTIGVENMAVLERATGVKLCDWHVGGSTVAAAGHAEHVLALGLVQHQR